MERAGLPVSNTTSRLAFFNVLENGSSGRRRRVASLFLLGVRLARSRSAVPSKFSAIRGTGSWDSVGVVEVRVIIFACRREGEAGSISSFHEVVVACVAVAWQNVVAPAPVVTRVAMRAVGILESGIFALGVESIANFFLVHLLDESSLQNGAVYGIERGGGWLKARQALQYHTSCLRAQQETYNRWLTYRWSGRREVQSRECQARHRQV